MLKVEENSGATLGQVGGLGFAVCPFLASLFQKCPFSSLSDILEFFSGCRPFL